MIRKNHFLIFLAALLLSFPSFSQDDRKDKTAVTYEELYDEPSSIRKLFVQIQPLYGEMFVTNVTAGFGGEVTYFHKDKFDIHAHIRKTYGQKFYDFSRDLASKNSDLDNRAQVFNYFELGGTYHIKDFEKSSKTKMFLFKNSYKGNKWAARVPLSAEVPCKVRNVYGLRLGAIYWKSSADLNRALAKQNLTNADLKTAGGVSLPEKVYGKKSDLRDLSVFSNISSAAVYLGGSMSWIKNVAVDFDKYEEGVDDLMFTVFVDLIYAPSIKVDNIVFTGQGTDPDGNTYVKGPNYSADVLGTNTYSVDPLKTSNFGFRAGIDGKFNRTWGWGYGGEVGYRPSLQGRSFYAMFKISFPVFATNLDYKVESFGK